MPERETLRYVIARIRLTVSLATLPHVPETLHIGRNHAMFTHPPLLRGTMEQPGRRNSVAAGGPSTGFAESDAQAHNSPFCLCGGLGVKVGTGLARPRTAPVTFSAHSVIVSGLLPHNACADVPLTARISIGGIAIASRLAQTIPQDRQTPRTHCIAQSATGQADLLCRPPRHSASTRRFFTPQKPLDITHRLFLLPFSLLHNLTILSQCLAR